MRPLVAGALSACLLVYCLTVLFDWLPWLRGWRDYPQGWTWATYPMPALGRFVPVLLIVAGIWLAVILAETLLRSSRAGARVITVLFLSAMVLLSYGLQVSLLGLKAANGNGNTLLVERVTNRVFTGYFNLAASNDDPNTFFGDYPTVFSTRVCPHCHDHPPGPGLFYWLTIQAAKALPSNWQESLAASTWRSLGDSPTIAQLRGTLSSAQILGAHWGGSLVLLFAALTVVPLYGLARLLGPPGWDLRLSALGLALPGLMLMAPTFDQTFALVTASALLFGLRGLLSGSAARSALWAFAAGLVVSAGLYFSWALGVVLAILGALGLAALLWSRQVLVAGPVASPRLPPSAFLRWTGALAAGAFLPLALVMLLTGLDLPSVLQYNLANAAHAESQRPYAVWVFYGPLDFFQFLGLPLALATLLSLLPRAAQPRQESTLPLTSTSMEPAPPSSAPWHAKLNPYAVMFWLVILGLDLAGRSKAEQGRLLIFMMPLALAAVYFWLGRSRPDPRLVTALFAAQMLVMLSIGARWFVP